MLRVHQRQIANLIGSFGIQGVDRPSRPNNPGISEDSGIVRTIPPEIRLNHLIHVQMQQHFWEDAFGYEVVMTRGYTELRPSAYSVHRDDLVLDFRQSPADKSNMSRYLFGGFQRCLYTLQKFQSEAEGRLAVILEREANKWFKPARGNFNSYGDDTRVF